MSSIDNTSAAIFFAELLLPLRYTNLRRGIAYLYRGQRRQSYWGEVASRTGGMERLSSAGCDATALLSSLGGYWVLRHESNLLQLLPHLERLGQELAGTASTKDQAADQLTEFRYPLF
jgi:hypothetical protein